MVDVDPLSDIRAAAAQARNRPATPPGAAQVLPGSLPGQPGYTSRIPPPDGPAIGEVADNPVPYAMDVPAIPVPIPQIGSLMAGAPPPRRVVVYCGRGEDFIVSVEESQDDDALFSKRYSLETLMPILDVVRALGIKVIDRTGGELQSHEITLRASREQGPARAATNGAGSKGESTDWAAVPVYQGAE